MFSINCNFRSSMCTGGPKRKRPPAPSRRGPSVHRHWQLLTGQVALFGGGVGIPTAVIALIVLVAHMIFLSLLPVGCALFAVVPSGITVARPGRATRGHFLLLASRPVLTIRLYLPGLPLPSSRMHPPSSPCIPMATLITSIRVLVVFLLLTNSLVFAIAPSLSVFFDPRFPRMA